jgi:adenosylcobinamide-phosphate synthase
LLADAMVGEPPARAHPVVWIGQLAAALVRFAPTRPAAQLVYGAFVTGAVVGLAGLVGRMAACFAARLPFPLGLLVEGWLLKTTLSARALIEAAETVEGHLDDNDPLGAREAVRSLVSRDPTTLGEAGLASAAIESLAENTADSIVGPLLAYSIGGLPWACAYRAANTLDAMIGYHGEYEYLGKVAARLDDALNIVPARLTSLLLTLGGAMAGGDVGNGVTLTLRDHALTASPNAGWPMSTMAGLLGIRLEKVGHYRLAAELPRADVPAIDHAVEIVKAATVLSVPVVMGIGWLARRAGRFPRPGGQPARDVP